MKEKFTFIDLFAGIGGFRMAIEQNGGECLYFSEINSDAINTYCENSDILQDRNLGDITKIKELPSHNLLTGGVPCQSWSIAGKNLGFDDDRGQLWNDTIYLLNQSKPDAFIFENVKGLVDPRNKEAFEYILERIKEAGYYSKYYLINSFDYGVPQNRLRVYIVGFKNKKFADKFILPKPLERKVKLSDILSDYESNSNCEVEIVEDKDLFGNAISKKVMSLSSSNGLNDYFLFNDLRNGDSTIHSWDIIDTTVRQKDICYLLLKNRRKKAYGAFDGNPLSLQHFKSLDKSIDLKELEELVELKIFKEIEFSYKIKQLDIDLDDDEKEVLLQAFNDKLNIETLKNSRELKIKKINYKKIIESLKAKDLLEVSEIRYDFKNTKISTGINGINRIFLPSSNIFPTLVASDTNDFVSTVNIQAKDEKDYRMKFLEEVYIKNNYRRITKEEACLIQGFPKDYILPENRARWMKLIGNSVSVPVIDMLVKAVKETGVFSK